MTRGEREGVRDRNQARALWVGQRQLKGYCRPKELASALPTELPLLKKGWLLWSRGPGGELEGSSWEWNLLDSRAKK